MKVRKRAVSSTPAMPITRCLGKPLTQKAGCTIASSGFVTQIRIALGECWATDCTTCVTMPWLVRMRSSRLIPGLRAMPDVMTTISEFAVSS